MKTEEYFQIPFDDKNYNFDKINLVTITYKGKMADKYFCSKNAIIGYRFGVDNYISVPIKKKTQKIIDKYK